MATAGRILIIPKGKWESENEYEALDLVSHNGNSWLCKKTASGIEPTEDNVEYWFKFTDNASVDAELEEILKIVAGKADQTALDALSNTVAGKADRTELNALAETVAGMSSQTDFEALSKTVEGKADQAALEELSETVEGKADQAALEELNSKIVYRDHEFDNIGFTAGSIGTRGAQYEWNIQEYINQGFLCVGAFVTFISNSADMQPVVFMTSGTVYLNLYRATSEATSGGRIYIRILLIKN